LNGTVKDLVKDLWANNSFKTAFTRYSSTYQHEVLKPYFDRIDEFAADEAVLSVEYHRKLFDDSGQYLVSKDSSKFRITLAGEDESELETWAANRHDGEIQAVVFFADLSVYNEVSPNDKKTNNMVELLMKFEELCTQAALAKTPIILFLHNIEEFKRKILNYPLTVSKWFANPRALTYKLENVCRPAPAFASLKRTR